MGSRQMHQQSLPHICPFLKGLAQLAIRLFQLNFDSSDVNLQVQ